MSQPYWLFLKMNSDNDISFFLALLNLDSNDAITVLDHGGTIPSFLC